MTGELSKSEEAMRVFVEKRAPVFKGRRHDTSMIGASKFSADLARQLPFGGIAEILLL